MKRLVLIILTLMLSLSFSGCGKKSTKDFQKEVTPILKKMSRNGNLDKIYKDAQKNYEAGYKVSSRGNFGAFLNTVTNGLKNNGYPVDELFEVTINNDSLNELEKEGIDKKVASAYLAYLAILSPLSTLGSYASYYIPIIPKDFLTMWDAFDKHGVKSDKDTEKFYNDTINSNYGKFFDLDL